MYENCFCRRILALEWSNKYTVHDSEIILPLSEKTNIANKLHNTLTFRDCGPQVIPYPLVWNDESTAHCRGNLNHETRLHSRCPRDPTERDTPAPRRTRDPFTAVGHCFHTSCRPHVMPCGSERGCSWVLDISRQMVENPALIDDSVTSCKHISMVGRRAPAHASYSFCKLLQSRNHNHMLLHLPQLRILMYKTP